MAVEIPGARPGEPVPRPLGGWQAKYIPAFLRRYPFVFSSNDDGNNFVLRIDEGFPGFNQPGEKLAEMARNDELELVYAHLHSMGNFVAMRERFEASA
jgi:hypothetical protein